MNGASTDNATPSFSASLIHSYNFCEVDQVGGVEWWIDDFLAFSKNSYQVLGLCENGHSGVKDRRDGHSYLQIASLSRRKRIVPHALWLALGMIRNRRRIAEVIFLHRIELVLLARILKPKASIVLFIHTDLYRQGRFKAKLKRWTLSGPLYFQYERLALKQVDFAVVQSSTDFSRISRVVRDSMLARGWYNDEVFSEPRSTIQSRNGVIWVGRLEEEKDPMLAIEAFASSAAAHNQSLSIVGTGSLADRLERQIAGLGLAGRVHLLGFRSREQVRDLLQKAKVLLHSAHFEATPKVFLEAISQGCKIVCPSDADPEGWAVIPGLGRQVGNRSPIDLGNALVEILSAKSSFSPSTVFLPTAKNEVPRVEALIFERLERVSSS